MGRKIVCPDCGSIVDEDILKAKNSENTCLVCGANLGGDSINKAEEHSDWITWYYYGDKDDNGKTTTLRDKPLDLSKWDDEFLIKEFKAPPRDANGSSEKAKDILRTYIPDAFAPPAYDSAINEIRCPRCGSNRIQLVGRKWSWLTGIATNKVDRVCMNCKTRF